jgi:hypothetical protein
VVWQQCKTLTRYGIFTKWEFTLVKVVPEADVSRAEDPANSFVVRFVQEEFQGKQGTWYARIVYCAATTIPM